MSTTQHELAAMRRALALAATPGVPLGPNPRVGCVLLALDGTPLGEGFHAGAGTPHAEVVALAAAGDRARGATAVVTLEPCRHAGRTGPCSEALLAAGVRRVVHAEPDPTSQAAGGAEVLRAACVEVEGGLLREEAAGLNRAWHFGLTHQRPLVRWKLAATIDGRSAAADGTSRWVSSPAARVDSHRLRAECDVMLVGTGTVADDDPRLTVRDAADVLLPHQPVRAVMGERELAADRRVLDDEAPTVLLRTRAPREALAQLYDAGRRFVFLEGGPTLAAAFLREALVDEVVAYVAPKLLGSGLSAVADLGISTMSGALDLTVTDVATVGTGSEANVRITMVPGLLPAGEAA